MTPASLIHSLSSFMTATMSLPGLYIPRTFSPTLISLCTLSALHQHLQNALIANLDTSSLSSRFLLASSCISSSIKETFLERPQPLYKFTNDLRFHVLYISDHLFVRHEVYPHLPASVPQHRHAFYQVCPHGCGHRLFRYRFRSHGHGYT